MPITSNYGSESPLSGFLQGPAAIDYLKTVGPEMDEIRLIQHVVEGNFVATLFEEIVAGGPLPVFALFELKDSKVRFVRVFFDRALTTA